MIEQGLFKRHFVGRDGFVWWIGQVVSEEKWSGNIPGKRTETTEDHKGFGERYKVRIMGYHTANKKELTDEQLPWASVMYPVTAGGGGAGTWSNAAIRQGNFVFGFFLDGEDAQQPVIMGVLGTNQYTSLASQDNPDIAFFPFSGYTNTNTVAKYSQSTTQEQPKGTQTDSKSPASNVSKQESPVEKKDAASAQAKKDAEKKEYIPTTCEKIPLGAIQIQIKNLIKDIERIKASANTWESKITSNINNAQNEINKAVNKATEFISSGIKWLIYEVQKYITRKINSTLKDTYYNLFPDQRSTVKNAVETANDLIACLFRKIISNLLKMIGKFLLSAVDRFINTPLCAVENFVGALIGKLAGLINSAVSNILGPLTSLVGAAFDIADSILDFIIDVLSFLSCDEEPSCAEIREWSIWEGSEMTSKFDLNSVVDKVRSFASNITTAIDPDTFDFDLDFSDVFEDTCNVGPIFCGPPIVEFYGGGGSGASGNAIVSAAGDILGVDITSFGSGYTSAPFVNFKDNCGNGRGASGRTVIADGQVINVIIDEPGTGYLPTANGSLGGDGRTWSGPGDTIVKRANGIYDTPYKSGSIINLFPGDTVQSCGRPIELIAEQKTITAPVCSELPLSPGDYPVILEIGNVDIANSGYSYSEGDRIVVNPDNGSILKPTFDNLGSLTGVNIISSGTGFTEVPEIYVESDTGYNAKIIPIFNIKKVGAADAQAQLTRIISVVDCVGKF